MTPPHYRPVSLRRESPSSERLLVLAPPLPVLAARHPKAGHQGGTPSTSAHRPATALRTGYDRPSATKTVCRTPARPQYSSHYLSLTETYPLEFPIP